jgi:hypothetical protein
VGGRDLRIGEFCLSNETNDTTVALYVREERKIVDGRALIFNASGPHNLMMEIHYIQLENGNKWVIGGRAFNGPMWIFSQLNKRLKISVYNKEQGFAMDLTIPTPSKKNPDRYTTSMTTIRELSGIYPNIFNLLQENGVDEIDLRSNLLNDTSTRKKFYTCLMKNPDCPAPVLIYFLTRIVAITKEYEKLLDEGMINSEQASHYAEFKFQESKTGADEASSIISGGESGSVEFKPAIWFDFSRAKNDSGYVANKSASRVRDKIIRTVAGFLNADGGTLFIGISDDGDSYGIQKDVELSGRGDLDGYELDLFSMLTNTLEKQVVARKVRVSFPEHKGVTIARVDVQKSDEPVFANTSQSREEFFVRIGNSTNRLSVQSAMSYVAKHEWGESDSLEEF